MSIENRLEKYFRSFLTLTLAFSLQSCKALPENEPTITQPPATPEFTPTPTEQLSLPTPKLEKQYPTPENIIFPSPTPVPTFTPIPIPPTRTKEMVIPEISLSLWEERTYQAIQELRKERNLPTLELSSSLTEIARQRSLDMATRNYFSHTTPEGLMVFDLLDQTGNYYPYAGENLARTNLNDSQIEEVIQEIMKEFLESRGHRRNLLRPEFSLIGVGFAFSEEDNIKYITIVFASFPE